MKKWKKKKRKKRQRSRGLSLSPTSPTKMEQFTELQKYVLHGMMAVIGFVGAWVWYYARDWWIEKEYWKEFEEPTSHTVKKTKEEFKNGR